jgi:ribonuclease-3
MAAAHEAADPDGLAEALGVTLDRELLRRALTHRSFAYEQGGLPHNERLEFLGDSVLGVVITETLYRTYPDLPEGKLAKLRASVVNMRALADIARRIGPNGLGLYLRLGRGEEVTGGRDKASILADTVEALLGAIYLEHGLATAERVIHNLFDRLLAEVANHGAGLDWKTSLQELTAELALGVPDYVITSVGPDHAKTFTARASVNGEVFEPCTGRNKKEAEQGAAETAWRMLSARAAAIVVTEPADPA